MKRATFHNSIALALLSSMAFFRFALVGASIQTEANVPAEILFQSTTTYTNPFTQVTLDVEFTDPSNHHQTVPAFWAGGDRWKVRYASPAPGQHHYLSHCSNQSDTGLHATQGVIEISSYTGSNSLLQHGQLHVAPDQRHFEHIDGAPFFWLGDTWWKNLCKRMTWEGFQELTADRRAKGFSVVQIVCGPYPDEGPFEARWENEGGKPYETHDFNQVNPAYFEFADRRISHLVNSGIVPAIVGGWGRGDCDGMKLAGVEGMKRHWRHLISRYAAYPGIWIIGGESEGPLWTEVARYVRQLDPYHHPITIHPHQSGRSSVTDETVIDFDMLQTGHGDWAAATNAIPQLKAAYARIPAMPVLIGEYCYEGHMQTAFQDVQRYVFWSSLLSGSAGLTYGAAGVWHASIDGDPGLANIYDMTTWQEGMRYPGSTQLGMGKKLLEQYPWWRFEPHPEWTTEGSFAAGISNEVRFIYLPRRRVYDWSGPVVRQLERDVRYQAFYFDPAKGRRFEAGSVLNPGPAAKPFEGHTEPRRFVDRFEGNDSNGWKDYGTPSRRQSGQLIGTKGMLTIQENFTEADLMASVEARNDAEAGIILRFHSPDDYLVALYTPSLKAIYLHDRHQGSWGDPLGKVAVPALGPHIKLTAAACGEYAALVLADGPNTYFTPIIRVNNKTAGKTGLWLYQIGEQQEFSLFEISRTRFTIPLTDSKEPAPTLAWNGLFQAPNTPTPQDWVLVMEKSPH